MSIRRKIATASIVACASLLVMCSSDEASVGGVMIEVINDGTVAVSRLEVNVLRQDGTKAVEGRFDNPRLPNTVGVANTHPNASADIAISAFRADGEPVERRDYQLRNIPNDRIIGLRVVLSGGCSPHVSKGPAGEARSDCRAGTTCNPTSGSCATSAIDGATLPVYDPGDETKPLPRLDASLTPPPLPDASGDASPEVSTIEDAGDASDAPVGCGTGKKTCNGSCVQIDDPLYGCTASSCTSCGSGKRHCEGSTCVLDCAAGEKNCGGTCVKVNDPNFGCGAATCSKATCPDPGAGTIVCNGSTCEVGVCGSGTKKCGNACVPEDPSHGCKGASCTPCASTSSSTAICAVADGTCAQTCNAGYKSCSGSCVAITDPAYGCGTTSCDATACPATGGGTLVCSGTTCTIGSCGSGTKSCSNACVSLDEAHGCSVTSRCTPCASGEQCVGGAGVSTCQCVPEPVATTCSRVECGTTGNNCGTSISCSNPCGTPPATTCSPTDPRARRVYNATGSCAGNSCTYSFNDVTCSGGNFCVAGACQPLVLASGEQNLSSLALSGTRIYWGSRNASSSTIRSVPLTGGTAALLTNVPADPNGIVLASDGYIYIATQINAQPSAIYRVLATGGSIQTVAATLTNANAGAIVTDSQYVYWTNYNNAGNSIQKALLQQGTTAINVATALKNPTSMVLSGTDIIFANGDAFGSNGGVLKVPKAGGTVTSLATAPTVDSVVVDSTYAYWGEVEGSSIGIKRTPLAGGTTTVLAGTAQGIQRPTQLVVDATYVYWTDGTDNSVRRVPIAGGTVDTLATGQTGALALAQDAGNIYWTTSNGNVVKLAKF